MITRPNETQDQRKARMLEGYLRWQLSHLRCGPARNLEASTHAALATLDTIDKEYDEEAQEV